MAAYSLSVRLHDFLKSKSLITEVALRMGMPNGQRLSMQLRPSNKNAKLGVEELISLCRAVRSLGHGNELEGILAEYMEVLHSGRKSPRASVDPVSMYIDLQRAMAAVSEATSVVLSDPNERSIKNALNLISTRLSGCLFSVRTLLDEQLDSIRRNGSEPQTGS